MSKIIGLTILAFVLSISVTALTVHPEPARACQNNNC